MCVIRRGASGVFLGWVFCQNSVSVCVAKCACDTYSRVWQCVAERSADGGGGGGGGGGGAVALAARPGPGPWAGRGEQRGAVHT